MSNNTKQNPTSTEQSSNRVGPVVMSHPIARAQLEETGTVYSFRTSDRTVGDTHYRYGRTKKGQGKVNIAKVTDKISPTPEQLDPYQDQSGFDSAEEWREAIVSINNEAKDGYIYRVEMLD